MARSAKKLRRLVGVFQDLETVERARVAELVRDMDELRGARDEILESIADPSPMHTPFVPLLSGRIGGIERRLQRLSREHEAALGRYMQAAARVKGSTELLIEAQGIEARKREQGDLEALLEFQEAAAAQGRCKSPRST
jgi:hypothetical protein